MDWLTRPPFDSWAANGGALTFLLFCARLAYWLWRRRDGVAPPLFGWIGTQLVLNYVVITQGIRLRTETAKVAKLVTIIREAGLTLPSEFRDGNDSSFAWPESTLMTSKRNSPRRSRSTSEQPDERRE